ncbi:MAG: ATP-binding protein [bacterium]
MPHTMYLQHLEELKTAIANGDSDKAVVAAIGLEQIAKRYHILLEQANDAILILDPESGRLLDWNSKAEEMLGYDSERLQTLSLSDLYPEEDLLWLLEEFQKNRRDGQTVTPEIPIIRGDGQRIYADSSSSLIQFGDSEVVQVILRDVTDRIQMVLGTAKHAQELEDKNEELARAQRLTSEFLASASHELLSPVEAILGDSRLLMDEEIHSTLNGTQKRTILNKIGANARQLKALLNGILDLSRLEAGVVPVLHEDIDLIPFVKDIFDPHRRTLAAKDLDGKVYYRARRIICRTDPTKLRQVLQELLTNATKFTDRGEVSVTLETNAETAMISVCDTGRGVPNEYLEHIFGLFRTGDRSFTRKHPGAGLGLTVVKKLTDLLGGRIRVETDVNVGTRLTVSLPGTVRSVEPAVEGGGGEIAEPHKSEVMQPVCDALVVDDDRYTVEILSEFLERSARCRVRKAYSGADAQLRLTERRPDYLFVDLLLPQMNGERILQYCETLWGRGSVTMIVVTGKKLTEAERAHLKNRAAAVIEKRNLRNDVLVEMLSPVIPLRELALPVA